MSAESMSIQVNFGKPFPLFPLDGAVLLPHALLRLFIFEPRYRQMIEHALDGAGQIAMAVFEGARWKKEYHGCPPIKPVVCIGQIVQHERIEEDGNYRILLQGVCRARIRTESPPDGDRLYRQAMLEPLEPRTPDEDDLFLVRDGVLTRLRSEPLGELAAVGALLRELDNRCIPTPALLEVVTMSVLNDRPLQYRLLAEGNIFRRGELIEKELSRLGGLVETARRQHDPDAPNGVTWN